MFTVGIDDASTNPIYIVLFLYLLLAAIKNLYTSRLSNHHRVLALNIFFSFTQPSPHLHVLWHSRRRVMRFPVFLNTHL